MKGKNYAEIYQNFEKSENWVLTIPCTWFIVVNVNGKRPQSLQHQIKTNKEGTQDDNNE